MPSNILTLMTTTLCKFKKCDIVFPKFIYHDPPLLPRGIVDFFDGAAQNCLCGGGGTLRLDDHSHFQFWIGFGEGTNTRGELLALWALFRLALLKQVVDILIIGDSKVIIDSVEQESSSSWGL